MKRNLILILATGFGVGYISKAPGTFGTLIGLVLLLIFPNSILLVIGVGLLGVFISHEAEKILEEKDSPKIVIDEIAGFLIAGFGWTGLNLLLAFLLFRLLDIFKPEPIGSLQKIPGGLGVMMDDLAAGFLANMAVRLASVIFSGVILYG